MARRLTQRPLPAWVNRRSASPGCKRSRAQVYPDCSRMWTSSPRRSADPLLGPRFSARDEAREVSRATFRLHEQGREG